MGTNSTEKGNFTMTKVENGEEGDAPFALPTWFVVAMLCTNLAGAALNGISARRIVDAFDTGRIIFTLLLADAVLGCAGCAVGAANAVALSRPSSNDHLACTSFFVATLVPILFGLVISSHISVMRYLSLKYGHLSVDLLESRFSRVTRITMGLFSLGTVLYVIAHLTVVRPFKAIGLCMHGPKVKASHPASGAIVAITFLSSSLVSVAFGLLTVRAVRNQVANISNSTGKKRSYTIPVKATILSAANTALLIVLVAVMERSSVPHESTTWIMSCMLFTINALRCPLAAFFTFTAKRNIDKETKAARQQWELLHAKKAREERTVPAEASTTV